MCVQDWRIGRLIRTQQTQFSIASGASESIVANAQRVGWTVGLNKQDTATSIYLLIQIDGKNFTILTRSHPLVHITLATHGDLPTKAFELFAIGLQFNPGLVEYLMPEKYLQSALEEFNTEYNL